MKNLDLGKQIGPLPLGAWVVVVGTGIGIAVYTRRQSVPTIEYEDGSSPVGVGEGGSGMWVDLTPPTESAALAPAIVTLEDWGKAAIRYLIAEGYDPGIADSAVRKYLAGEQLSLREFTLIGLALAKIGPTPVILPPPYYDTPPLPKETKPITSNPSTPVINPPPTTNPTSAFRYITVEKWPAQNSTLSGISKTAYGTYSRWPDLYNANRAGTIRADGTPGMVVNPDLIYAGWRILIP